MRRAATLVLTALTAATAGAGMLSGSSPVLLRSVSSHLEVDTAAVLIEAAEPVAYMASRPDPLTVLVDLRRVDTSGVRNRVAPGGAGPIAGVRLERADAPDGQALARVRVSLAEALPHAVRSSGGTILVEFDRTAPQHVGRPAAVPGPSVPAGEARDQARATVLSSVRARPQADGLVVTLGGNGRLEPGGLGEADAPPYRLFLDFPGVAASVPGATEVGLGPLERIRVAPHSRSPLVTRVFLDLREPVAYTVVPADGDPNGLAIHLRPEAAPASAVALDPIGALGLVPDPSPGGPPTRSRGADDGVAPSPGADPQGRIPRPAEPGTTMRTPDGGLVIDASGTTMTSARFIVPAERVPSVPPAVPVSRQVEQAGASAAVQPAASTYNGHPVTLDFQDADLRAVLRTFAEISGLNLVIDPAVAGRVDVSLREVPWDQALDIILRSNKLGYTVDGTVVRMAPLSVLASEEDERRRLADAQRLSGDLRVLTRTLSYARASNLSPLITRTALSQRGSVEVDTRTNTLIITDLQPNLDTAADLITALDQAEPQVEIEARIVQSTRDFAREIGVQWGITGRLSPELGNTTALAFPNRAGVSGRVGAQGPNDPRATDLDSVGTAVNLGANAPTSGIGLALGAVDGSLNLDVALSAAERTGQARILSTPKVATQNNTEAEITQGVQIPIQTVANNTVTVTFKDAALTLKVTPQITAADTVIMRVELENATPDFSRSVGGIPPINTQRAITQLQVDDGQTTVIGGIFEALEQTVRDRTPGMSRIPLLGWLFRRDSTLEDNRELLIFITPRIIR